MTHLHSESAHEQEIVGSALDYQQYSIEMGSVGWIDDQGPHFDLDTSPTDGTTLVKVQLYRGKKVGTKVVAGRAQGLKLLAQISGPLWHVPNAGTRCLVAIPGGMAETPGAAVIIALPGPAPASQYSSTRTKLDVGADHDLVIKAKSIALTDYSNRFISITSAGVVIQDTDGSGGVVQNGKVMWFSTNNTVLQLDSAMIQLFNNAGSMLKMDANFTSFGAANNVSGGTVIIGRAPTATDFAMVAPSPGAPSASVIISKL